MHVGTHVGTPVGTPVGADDAVTPTEGVGGYLARVRHLLRRFVYARAAWLPAPRNLDAGSAFVDFLLGRAPARAAVDPELAELGEGLASADEALVDEALVAERFARLWARLDLGPLEADLLWLVLAPELDTDFLSAYRLVWGDEARRYCDQEFLLGCLSPRQPGRLAGLVEPSSVLLRLRFLHRLRPSPASPWLYRPDARLLSYLLGSDRPPESLTACAEVIPPAAPRAWEGHTVAPALREALERRLGRRGSVLLRGPARAGADVVLRQLLAEQHRTLLRVDLEGLLEPAAEPPLLADDGALLREILREARLHDALLSIEGLELLAGVSRADAALLSDLLGAEPGPLVLHCRGELPLVALDTLVPRLRPQHLAVEPAAAPERRALWAHLLPTASEAELAHLATHPIGPAQMEQARWLHRTTGEPLRTVVQRLVTHRVGDLAERVEVTLGWDQLVLAPAVLEQVAEVRTLGVNYERLMKTWGLGRIVSGRGIKVLLSGPSGTGKTVLSGLLARDLGRELYRVDVSSVVSKWVGETEKHLARLFDEAESAGVALLFDEADSLFARRSTEVASATDRYANQNVNFLLQRVETFDGLVVLTTNLSEALDTAFARRLTYHIRLDRPGAVERAQLWRVHLPETIPLAPGLDLEALGERYDLAGGEIRMAVLRAGVRALQAGQSVVTLRDLEDGARAEYVQKGKLPPSRLVP
jgi:hypothetical protein